MHANSLANLKNGKRFGSGQPTNLGGAPSGKRLTTFLREIAEREITATDLNGEKTTMPVLQAVAMTLFRKAIVEGNIKAIEAILNLFGDVAAPAFAASVELAPAINMILEMSGYKVPGCKSGV